MTPAEYHAYNPISEDPAEAAEIENLINTVINPKHTETRGIELPVAEVIHIGDRALAKTVQQQAA